MTFRFYRFDKDDEHPMDRHSIVVMITYDGAEAITMKHRLQDAYGMGRMVQDVVREDSVVWMPGDYPPPPASWYWDFGQYTCSFFLTEESQITYVKLII